MHSRSGGLNLVRLRVDEQRLPDIELQVSEMSPPCDLMCSVQEVAGISALENCASAQGSLCRCPAPSTLHIDWSQRAIAMLSE